VEPHSAISMMTSMTWNDDVDRSHPVSVMYRSNNKYMRNVVMCSFILQCEGGWFQWSMPYECIPSEPWMVLLFVVALLITILVVDISVVHETQ